MGGYEGVKGCRLWLELESHLGSEDGERLKTLFRLARRRGSLPRTNAALVSKILSGKREGSLRSLPA